MCEVHPLDGSNPVKTRSRLFRLFSRSEKYSTPENLEYKDQIRTRNDLEDALGEVQRLRKERDALKNSLISHLTITILPDDPNVPVAIPIPEAYPAVDASYITDDTVKGDPYKHEINTPVKSIGLLKDAWTMGKEVPTKNRARDSPKLAIGDSESETLSQYSSEDAGWMVEEIHRLRQQLEQREDQLFRALLKLKELKESPQESTQVPQLQQIIAQQNAKQLAMEKQLEEMKAERDRMVTQNSQLVKCLSQLSDRLRMEEQKNRQNKEDKPVDSQDALPKVSSSRVKKQPHLET